jgi:hypothetical protein
VSENKQPATYRRDRGSYHEYVIDGQHVKGVTTLINAGLPKNLAKWGSEAVANRAIDEWDSLSLMPVSGRLKRLQSAPWDNINRAAIRGTRVHELAEKLGNGNTITVPADIKGYVEACRRFIEEWHIQPQHIELPVYSRTHKYAGTVDLIANDFIWDYKTSASGIWGSAAYQVTAYRYADFYLDDNGEERPIPEIEGCRGIHLMETGDYEVYPLESDRHIFEQFLAIQQVAQAVEDEKNYVGASLAPPVLMSL